MARHLHVLKLRVFTDVFMLWRRNIDWPTFEMLREQMAKQNLWLWIMYECSTSYLTCLRINEVINVAGKHEIKVEYGTNPGLSDMRCSLSPSLSLSLPPCLSLYISPLIYAPLSPPTLSPNLSLVYVENGSHWEDRSWSSDNIKGRKIYRPPGDTYERWDWSSGIG